MKRRIMDQITGSADQSSLRNQIARSETDQQAYMRSVVERLRIKSKYMQTCQACVHAAPHLLACKGCGFAENEHRQVSAGCLNFRFSPAWAKSFIDDCRLAVDLYAES